MKLPKPIKKVAIKIIGFVLSIPFLKNMVKRFLPQESWLYQKLYRGYHNATDVPVPINPVNVQGNTSNVLEQTFRTVALDQLQIFQMLLSHDDMLSEGVYDENCY